MERSERARAAVLEGALRRRANAIDRADEKALEAIRGAGFQFRSIAEAEQCVERMRELARIRTELIADFATAPRATEEAA